MNQSAPQRILIRDIFLRLLGCVFLIAFLSLRSQIDVLISSDGLLPVCDYVSASDSPWWQLPSLFRLACSDSLLHVAAIIGAIVSLCLIFLVRPQFCLVVLWLLYLSFVTAGRDFFSFQWDNLLLETAFFSFFIAPSGLHGSKGRPADPVAIFLLQWLLFRLHFESGAAKLLTGDPSWRDLTAMVSYYETAPLPHLDRLVLPSVAHMGAQADNGVDTLCRTRRAILYLGPPSGKDSRVPYSRYVADSDHPECQLHLLQLSKCGPLFVRIG